MNFLFVAICLFHTVFWIFVLLAFFSKKTAAINLYYVIPITYILHIFPFHFLNAAKQAMYPNDWEERAKNVTDNIPLIGPTIISPFSSFQQMLSKFCLYSPFSAQGMMIFGAITSAYALRR